MIKKNMMPNLDDDTKIRFSDLFKRNFKIGNWRKYAKVSINKIFNVLVSASFQQQQIFSIQYLTFNDGNMKILKCKIINKFTGKMMFKYRTDERIREKNMIKIFIFYSLYRFFLNHEY